MWADEKNANWLGVWSHLSHCPTCHTLMKSSEPCPHCGFKFEAQENSWTDASGVIHKPPLPNALQIAWLQTLTLTTLFSSN